MVLRTWKGLLRQTRRQRHNKNLRNKEKRKQKRLHEKGGAETIQVNEEKEADDLAIMREFMLRNKMEAMESEAMESRRPCIRA